MHKSTFLTIIILLCAVILPLHAQQYATTTNSAGEKVYSYFVNASTQYPNFCIQDNTKQNTSIPYLVSDYEKDNTLQLFELVAYTQDTTKYYVTNVSTKRWWTAASTESGDFNLLKSAFRKTASYPLTFTPIGGGQVLISFTEGGETKYLNAADSVTVNQKVYLEQAQDSRYAWYIVKTDQTLTGIENTSTIDEKVQVHALDGHIIVAGTNDYEIYDITGRQMPKIGRQSPGLYIIRTSSQNFKVLVK